VLNERCLFSGILLRSVSVYSVNRLFVIILLNVSADAGSLGACLAAMFTRRNELIYRHMGEVIAHAHVDHI
jgi:hypothetical protein